MRRLSIVPVLTLALLAGCERDRAPETPRGEATAQAEAGSSFAVDPETGETRAEHRDGDGSLQMRSGKKVPVSLAEGFTAFPGAEVVSQTQVARDGAMTTITVMEAAAEAGAMTAFYRRQAQAALVVVDVDIAGKDGRTLSGNTAAGLRFSFHETRAGGLARGTLTLAAPPP